VQVVGGMGDRQISYLFSRSVTGKICGEQPVHSLAVVARQGVARCDRGRVTGEYECRRDRKLFWFCEFGTQIAGRWLGR
jgi:hypothetical protein